MEKKVTYKSLIKASTSTHFYVSKSNYSVSDQHLLAWSANYWRNALFACKPCS